MGGDCFQMSRFFVSGDSVDPGNNIITISGEDVRHIRNVLRCAPGEVLQLSDGSGTGYEAAIGTIGRDSITTNIIRSWPNKTEPPLDITLFQGVPKGDKMEFIIQKCVEAGVSRIVPVITDRTVVKFANSGDSAAKAVRWNRIALESAKQCDRGKIPKVEEPVRFDEALRLAECCSLKLFPYEEERSGNIRKYLSRQKQLCEAGNKANVAVFIGPEGGFAPSEAQKAAENGFRTVTLGPRILRTETAGIMVISVIMYELGGMTPG